MTLEQKRKSIEPGHRQIAIYRQYELLGLNRSSLYYKPCRDTQYNEQLMRLLDEQDIETPFYGIDKMTKWLRCQVINYKNIAKLAYYWCLGSRVPVG